MSRSFLPRQRLSSYLDGALSLSGQEEVEQAMARDPDLADDYQLMRDAVTRFREAGRVPAPPGLIDQVLDGVRGGGWSPRGATARLSGLGGLTPRGPLAVLGLAGAFALGAALVGERDAGADAADADALDPELVALHAEIAAATPPAGAHLDEGSGDEVPDGPGPDGTAIAAADADAPTLDEVLAGREPSAVSVSPDGVVRVGAGSAPTIDGDPAGSAWRPQPNAARPESTTRIPSTRPVQGAGGQPYVADWEWAGGGLSQSLVYRLNPERGATDVLFLLDGVVDANGGELTNGAGLDMEPRMLEPGDYLSVRVKLPAEKLGAVIGELERQRVGELREATAFPERLPEGEIEVDFEITMP